MASEEHPEHLAASDDANTRAEFMGVLQAHQYAISELIEALSAREVFASSRVIHAIAGMRRALATFEGTALRVSEFADQHIGQI